MKGALNAQNAYGPYRSRYGEANNKTFYKKGQHDLNPSIFHHVKQHSVF
jgi:hypothetical protein